MMEPELRIIVIALTSAVLVPIIIKKLSRADRQDVERGGGVKMLTYSLPMRVAMWVCAAFFLAISFLAFKFPGRTDPVVLPFAIATFIAFGVCSLLTVLFMYKADVFWTDTTITGPDLIGRRHEIAWSDVSSIDYIAWAQCLRLTSRSGVRVWLSPAMQGFSAFEDDMYRLVHDLEVLGGCRDDRDDDDDEDEG